MLRFALFLTFAFIVSPTSADEIRILSIGDSISASNINRTTLRQRLITAGIAHDFVGDNVVPIGDDDINHQAFGGKTFYHNLNGTDVAQDDGTVVRQAGLTEVLELYAPDVIIVVSGYNNLVRETVGGGLSETRDQYTALVDFISAESDAHTFFANITDFHPDRRWAGVRQNVFDWNQWLAEDIAARQAEGQLITLVDNFSNVSHDDLRDDGLHLLRSGQEKVGDNLFSAIAASSVPEPSSAVLLFGLLLANAGFRRRI